MCVVTLPQAWREARSNACTSGSHSVLARQWEAHRWLSHDQSMVNIYWYWYIVTATVTRICDVCVMRTYA